MSQEKIQFQPVTVQDLPDIRRIQPEGWHDIIPAFRFYLQNSFCHPVKALVSEEIVGCGVLIVHQNVCWLAGIIVHAKHRKKGIGTAITQKLLEMGRSWSENFLLIATPFGRPIYEKLGFKNAGNYVLFARNQLSLPISENIKVCSEEYSAALLELDSRLSGESRPELIRPHLRDAFIYEKDSVVQGFYLPSLGEGMIYASDADAGLALLSLRLLEEKHTIIPVENTAAIRFLTEKGFKTDESKVFLRMSLGESFPWRPDCLYSRAGGNFG